MKKYNIIIKIVSVVVVGVAGVFIGMSIPVRQDAGETTITENHVVNSTPKPIVQTYPSAASSHATVKKTEPSLNTKPKIESAKIVKDDERWIYFCTVIASVESKDALKYILLDNGVEKYTSKTGRFTNIDPTASGIYSVRVVNAKTGEYTVRQVEGKAERVIPIGKEELENIFNRVDKETNYHPYVKYKLVGSSWQKDVKITIENVPEGDNTLSTDFDQLIYDLGALELQVEIENLKYAPSGKIESFVVRIK